MPAAQARRRAEPQAAPAARHLARGPAPRHAAATGMPAFAGVYLRRKAQCGCGSCAACAAAAPGVAVSQPGDALEREADELARRVMRSAAPAAAPAAASAAAAAGGAEAGLLPSGGQRLDAATRAFMEPRFGADFGAVRVHAGPAAGQRAQALAARAYAVGEHLVFGAGEYAPQTASGRQLIAHELAHVVQGRAGRLGGRVSRTVDAGRLNCPPNTHGAPADPAAALAGIDGHAYDLALTLGILTQLSADFGSPATGGSKLDFAYQNRFGPPDRVGRLFRDRFSGRTHANEDEAARQEMGTLAHRFDEIAQFLARPRGYRCVAHNVRYRLGSACLDVCPRADLLRVCPTGHGNQIGVCPLFWSRNFSDNQRALGLIHEAAHMRFGFGHPGIGSRAARGRNPECYASMVGDFYNIVPFDPKCRPV
jgi:hypothetical protein